MEKETNWEKSVDKWTKLEFNIRENIKDFIRKLLAQEEANWMAEIHEQLEAQKHQTIKELENEILISTDFWGDWGKIKEKVINSKSLKR